MPDQLNKLSENRARSRFSFFFVTSCHSFYCRKRLPASCSLIRGESSSKKSHFCLLILIPILCAILIENDDAVCTQFTSSLQFTGSDLGFPNYSRHNNGAGEPARINQAMDVMKLSASFSSTSRRRRNYSLSISSLAAVGGL